MSQSTRTNQQIVSTLVPCFHQAHSQIMHYFLSMAIAGAPEIPGVSAKWSVLGVAHALCSEFLDRTSFMMDMLGVDMPEFYDKEITAHFAMPVDKNEQLLFKQLLIGYFQHFYGQLHQTAC